VIASVRSLSLALAVGCALTFAACSGGGGSAPAPKPYVPFTPQNVAKASGTLTIKFSHIKAHLTASAKKSGGANKRAPRFIDPYGTFLEISSYATDTTASLGIFNYPTGVTFVQLQNQTTNPDGSFTVTVPIISSPNGQTNVYIYEVADGTPGSPPTYPSSPPSYNDVISYGEGVIPAVTAGSTNVALPVTLQLAPIALGLSYTPTVNEGEAMPLSSTADGAGTFVIDQYYGPSTEDPYAYAFVVGADLEENIDLCYFYPPNTTGSGGMPQINLVSQSPDNGGQSRIGTAQNGAWVYYPDDSENGVSAEFQTVLPAFPTDGPYYNYPNNYPEIAPLLPGESVPGFVDFEYGCYDCG
jgi:hypothetical protein